MMYCTFCGKEIENNSKYCSYCGNEITNENTENATKSNTKGKVFAYIGFGLGIQAFVMSIIPFVCFYSYISCIPGIIFSNNGMDSSKVKYAKKGKLFNKLAFIFGPIMSVITIIIIVLLSQYWY